MKSNPRNSVIWQIDEPNRGTLGYLMGTMHVRDQRAYTYVRIAESLIQNCDAYAGEMHLEKAEQANLHQYFTLSDSITLDQLFTTSQYRKIGDILAQVVGADISHVRHLMPMAISNMIAESWLSDDYGLSSDRHLWNVAESAEKMMNGLESVEDQINILNQIPLQYQITGLKRIIRNVKKYRMSILQLSDLYAQGRIHAIYRKTQRSLGQIKSLMLYDRNERMTDTYLSLSREGTLFAAVGAAHLSGAKGMLHKLVSRGYRIIPISVVS